MENKTTMKAKEFKDLLIRLESFKTEWADGKSWEQVYQTCERGEWLLWLYTKTNPDDKRLRVLAAAHCANAVRHLMTDERSTKAVDAAIAYGNGEIDENELSEACNAAAEAATTDLDAANAAATAWSAANAAAGWAAWSAASVRDYEPSINTGDIFRKYIPIEKFNI